MNEPLHYVFIDMLRDQVEISVLLLHFPVASPQYVSRSLASEIIQLYSSLGKSVSTQGKTY